MQEGEKDEQLEKVWSGGDQTACVSVCERFKKAEIPFRVGQRRRQFLKGVDEHYEIEVPAELLEKARAILAKGCLDFTDAPADLSIMELAKDGGADSAELLRSASRGGRKARTVEVFSEDAPEKIWMVELCFRENSIEYRSEIAAGGARKLYVSNEDTALALEIVREIRSGTPPT